HWHPKFDRTHMERFLGFLEGRLCTTIPKHWESNLLNGEEPQGRRRMFRKGEDWPESHAAGLGLAAANDTSIETVAGAVRVSMRGASVTLPSSIFDKTRQAQPNCNCKCVASIGAERTFIAIHHGRGFPFWLSCIDSRSGELVWENLV